MLCPSTSGRPAGPSTRSGAGRAYLHDGLHNLLPGLHILPRVRRPHRVPLIPPWPMHKVAMLCRNAQPRLQASSRMPQLWLWSLQCSVGRDVMSCAEMFRPVTKPALCQALTQDGSRLTALPCLHKRHAEVDCFIHPCFTHCITLTLARPSNNLCTHAQLLLGTQQSHPIHIHAACLL